MSDLEWMSIYDEIPKEIGWYATLHCWDIMEGFFAGAAHWNGERWDTTKPISNFIDRVFNEYEDALLFAEKHDPNW